MDTTPLGGFATKARSSNRLVEELAGILWRKRRLRPAEASALRQGLNSALAPHRHAVRVALVHLDETDQAERAADAIRATAEETAGDIVDRRPTKQRRGALSTCSAPGQ